MACVNIDSTKYMSWEGRAAWWWKRWLACRRELFVLGKEEEVALQPSSNETIQWCFLLCYTLAYAAVNMNKVIISCMDSKRRPDIGVIMNLILLMIFNPITFILLLLKIMLMQPFRTSHCGKYSMRGEKRNSFWVVCFDDENTGS